MQVWATTNWSRFPPCENIMPETLAWSLLSQNYDNTSTQVPSHGALQAVLMSIDTSDEKRPSEPSWAWSSLLLQFHLSLKAFLWNLLAMVNRVISVRGKPDARVWLISGPASTWGWQWATFRLGINGDRQQCAISLWWHLNYHSWIQQISRQPASSWE